MPCYFSLMTILWNKLKNAKYRFWLQKGVKIISNMFLDPPSPNCGWFHLLFLTHDHFIKAKAEKRKCRFWLQKGVKNNIKYVFWIRDHQIVGGFICCFWLITILSSQELKNTKHRFWLQKGVKNSIWQIFLIRDPQIVGGFICYFWLKIIFDER